MQTTRINFKKNWKIAGLLGTFALAPALLTQTAQAAPPWARPGHPAPQRDDHRGPVEADHRFDNDHRGPVQTDHRFDNDRRDDHYDGRFEDHRFGRPTAPVTWGQDQETVAHAIENSFHQDAALSGLGTDTVGNTIELEGTVNNRFELQRAIGLAQRMAPGFAIVSRIDVRR